MSGSGALAAGVDGPLDAPGGPAPDVLVVGAGVIGCAVAWRLRQAGLSCTLLERSVPGAEASSAAGGILAPQAESDGPGPFLDLCLASRALYGDFVRELVEVAGFDVGYRPSGVLRVAFDEAQAHEARETVRWQRARGLDAQWLDGGDARALEPALAPSVVGAARFPEDAVVDNRLLARALSIAAARAGARFVTAQVQGLVESGGRVTGVLTEAGPLGAGAVVLAAGAWTALVPGALPTSSAVRPARGQMAALHTRVPPLRHVVFAERGYAIPRTDGRLLVGTTLEFVGFDKQVTAAGLASVLGLALRLLPSVAEAPVLETWAGFRPHTPDGLPILGAASRPGLFVASGHFRNGILLTPVTAELLTDSILGRPPRISLQPFHPDRFRT